MFSTFEITSFNFSLQSIKQKELKSVGISCCFFILGFTYIDDDGAINYVGKSITYFYFELLLNIVTVPDTASYIRG
jgi:hypothetical protein